MSSKIYFAGSIRGGRDDATLYHKIIETLKTYGQVFTEHVGDDVAVKEGMPEVSNSNLYVFFHMCKVLIQCLLCFI